MKIKDDKGINFQRLRTVVKQLTMDDFTSIGLSLLRSFDQYVEVEEELVKEYMLTNGWLKRQRLNKLAGESARGK